VRQKTSAPFSSTQVLISDVDAKTDESVDVGSSVLNTPTAGPSKLSTSGVARPKKNPPQKRAVPKSPRRSN
jgi:hypothetical protein